MASTTNESKWVAFRLDGEEFAVPIEQVHIIERMKPITKIPKVPAYVEGIINLRGQIIPIVNLRQRLGLAAHEPTDESRIVIVTTERGAAGLIVDEVTRVTTLPADTIEPPPAMIAGVSSGFILGVAKPEGRLIILMDHAKIVRETD